MKKWSPQRFRTDAERKDIKKEIIDNSIFSIKKILSLNSNVTPILTLNHLAYMAGVEYTYLRAIINRHDFHPYRFFLIRKKGGGNKRKIFIPEPQLLKVQRFIHSKILIHIPSHESSFAYIPNSSIFDAANIHTNSKWLIKLDIENFFETISEIDVYHIFLENGFSELLSFELARICTWPGPRSYRERKIAFKKKNLKSYKFYNDNSELGNTPQGAPTSPCLSNLVCKSLDEKMANLSERFTLRYSRYSDDIVFSSDSNKLSRHDALEIIRSAYEIINNFGFIPNKNKTKIVPPGARKIVLGLNVEKDEVGLDKMFKYKIKQHLHFCKHPNVGPVNHAKFKGFTSVIGFRNHLHGLILYSKSIDEHFGEKALDEFNAIKWPF
ncbi:reverse transcriptase family protein [Sodalis sp. RH24]|uniref:reverse transcriptase family protein n=1 Tax=unclassified Sodalis (in: enterobacteria) TaxID=2636512 RepID=UPI0039B6C0C9